MAKYSTGTGGGGDDGDACELCGRETSSRVAKLPTRNIRQYHYCNGPQGYIRAYCINANEDVGSDI